LDGQLTDIPWQMDIFKKAKEVSQSESHQFDL